MTGLYSVNLINVLNPDEYHSNTHTISVVISDLAGNLTTQTMDFDVDTLLPSSPDIVVERTISATPALDLNYWETIETFNDVQGVRFQLTEANAGDQIAAGSVTVNGVTATVVDQGSSVYFVARTDLVDSTNGLSKIGAVDFEVDGISIARPIFTLTAAGLGVSADGIYILIGNSTDGWQAHSVLGDGGNTPYSASATADTGTLDVSALFSGSNLLEFDVADASGNVNTYSEVFTSDLDQLSGQYFAVTPTAYNVDDGISGQDYIRLDVYVSEQALSEALGVSQFGGTAIDLQLDLPSEIFSMEERDVIITTSDIFTMASGSFDASSDVVRWSGFVESEVSVYNEPILTIDAKVDDFNAIKDKFGDVSLSIAKISDGVVTSQMDVLNLSYDINLSDLILTAYDLSI